MATTHDRHRGIGARAKRKRFHQQLVRCFGRIPNHSMLKNHRRLGGIHDLTKLSVRVVVGIVFLVSGLNKLRNLDAFASDLVQIGLALAMFTAPLGIPVELIGAVVLASGYRTRAGATLLIMFMMTAPLRSDFPILPAGNDCVARNVVSLGIPAIAIGLFFLAVRGGGRYSLDRVLRCHHGSED